METILILLAIVAVLALLIVAPSRASMWRAVRLYAEDHEAANVLIDERRAARKREQVAA
jgi:Tfp pilus assembly protein FimT